MKNLSTAVVLFCMLASVSFFSYSLPWKATIEKSDGSDHMSCKTTFTIDPKGNWSASSTYSNGNHIESGRVSSVLTLKSQDGSDVIKISQNRHVKGSLGGPTNKETTVSTGKLPEEVVDLIVEDKTVYECSVDSDF